MKLLSGLMLLSFDLLTGVAAAQAQAPAPGADLPLATIDSTRQFDIAAASNGEAYRIQIFIPGSKPPPGGFPVPDVLDGNVLCAVRHLCQRGADQGAGQRDRTGGGGGHRLGPRRA